MKVIARIYQGIIDFLILNLFITLVSLPVLVAWGLPHSWLSPFGNFFFGPFLSTFLLLSTICFFLECFYLPHGLFDWCLIKTTDIWQWCMALGPHDSFIGFSIYSFWALTIIALLSLFSIMFDRFKPALARLKILSFFFVCSLFVLYFSTPQNVSDQIVCTRKQIEIIKKFDQTFLIDRGAFSERSNPASWAQYHLIPEIIKKTGSMRIDHLIIPKPTIRALQAAAALCTHAQVKHIYYPAIEGELKGSYRRVFRVWYAIAKGKGVQLIAVKREMTLNALFELGLGKKIAYRDIYYSPLEIKHSL